MKVLITGHLGYIGTILAPMVRDDGQYLMAVLPAPETSHAVRATIDQAFARVIRACSAPRGDGSGTWLVDDMIRAYIENQNVPMDDGFKVDDEARA